MGGEETSGASGDYCDEAVALDQEAETLDDPVERTRSGWIVDDRRQGAIEVEEDGARGRRPPQALERGAQGLAVVDVERAAVVEVCAAVVDVC